MPPSTLASATAEGLPDPGATAGALPGARLARAWRSLGGAVGLSLTGVVLAAGVLAPLLATADPFALAGPPLAPPSVAHPMGTDSLGRDLWSGVLFGARTSLLVGGTVGVLALVLGLLVGLVSGWAGGWADDLLMRSTELVQVLPRFFLAVVAVALLGPGLDRVVLVLGLTSWPALARVVRAETVSLRPLEFVRAAEAAGAGPARILVQELLPNVLPPALVLLGLVVGQAILVEASLGFLGLADPARMSWGALAGEARGFLRTGWWLPLFPGLAVTAAVLGLNLLADALAAPPGRRR